MRNFEKHIKNKADDFQLDPLPDSFDKVMQALEGKKKRRFIFWLWFAVPGMMVACTGLFIHHFYSTSKKQIATTTYNQSAPSNTNTTSDQTDHDQKPTSITYTSSKSNTKNVPVKNENEIKTPVQENKPVVTNHTKTISNDYTRQTTINTDQKEPVTIQETRHKNESNNNSIDTGNKKTTVEKREPLSFLTGFKNQLSPLYIPAKKLFAQKNIISVHHPIIPLIKPEFSRFSLGAYTEIGASKSIFTNNAGTNGEAYTSSRESGDVFTFSYSAGLHFRYAPVRFLVIETGIGYTHYQSRQLVMDAGVSSSSMTEDVAAPDTAYTFSSFSPMGAVKEYYNNYGYISIPLKIYYQKKWKWTGIEAGGGIIFDIPVNTNSYTADETTSISYIRKEVKDSRLNMFGIQAAANIHMVFHVKKFSFYVGPTFKYRMNSMYDNNYIIQQNTYFIGGETGIRYNF